MSLSEIRAQLPIALIVGLIVGAFQWGLGKTFHAWWKSIKKPNRLKRYLIQGLRWTVQVLVTSGIVVVALVLILRAPRYVWLAQHAPNLTKALVAAPFQAKHGGLPCPPNITQPYLEKIDKLSRPIRDQEYMAALRWAFAEGLLEELDIHPTEDGGAKRDFRITPLGEQFIQELCRIRKL